jgi:hypothetical protein
MDREWRRRDPCLLTFGRPLPAARGEDEGEVDVDDDEDDISGDASGGDPSSVRGDVDSEATLADVCGCDRQLRLCEAASGEAASTRALPER